MFVLQLLLKGFVKLIILLGCFFPKSYNILMCVNVTLPVYRRRDLPIELTLTVDPQICLRWCFPLYHLHNKKENTYRQETYQIHMKWYQEHTMNCNDVFLCLLHTISTQWLGDQQFFLWSEASFSGLF